MFLDLAANRYSRLPPHLEQSLQQALRCRDSGPSGELDVLVRAGLLEWTRDEGSRIELTQAVPVRRSALETDFRSSLRASDAALATAYLLHARWAMRRDLRVLSLRCKGRGKDQASARAEQDLLELATRFAAARRLVPLQANCLRDSMALQRFLHRYGAISDLVIGIRAAPFRAHCWIQVDDAALNETVDGTSLFTPIYVS